jgi:hypothetical protein
MHDSDIRMLPILPEMKKIKDVFVEKIITKINIYLFRKKNHKIVNTKKYTEDIFFHVY